MTTRSTALAFLVFAVLCLPLTAQSPGELRSLTSQLERQMKDFAAAKSKAQRIALERFDTAIRKIENTGGMSAETRATLRRQLIADKERFKETGSWPEEGLPLTVQYDYSRALHKAYQPPARTLDAIIRLHDQANNEAGVTEWLETKAKLDQQVPGRADLTPGSRWEGTLTSADGRNLLVRLDITKLTGSLLAAELRQNIGVAGHPIFVLSGRVEGNGVTLGVTAVKRGRAQLREFQGFLIGDQRMVIQYAGIEGRRPITGMLVLRRTADKK